MSTAPAPDARRREASPLHALPALPATDRAESRADADAVSDAAAPGAGLPDARGSASPALRRGHMSGTDLDEAVARYAALYPGSDFHAARARGTSRTATPSSATRT
ncbi:hypothetical protein [Clavibacter capsici]|uniref:hypothetical protein n=1 Tax=Clavibacter capsici TaxID=1874630 RepID=UPI00287BC40F|nr:hypothetical protein [Clavibacter capsici]